jgi:hypothetical protein
MYNLHSTGYRLFTSSFELVVLVELASVLEVDEADDCVALGKNGFNYALCL